MNTCHKGIICTPYLRHTVPGTSGLCAIVSFACYAHQYEALSRMLHVSHHFVFQAAVNVELPPLLTFLQQTTNRQQNRERLVLFPSVPVLALAFLPALVLGYYMICVHTCPNLSCGSVLWNCPAKRGTFSSSPLVMWQVGPTENSSWAIARRLERVTFARATGCRMVRKRNVACTSVILALSYLSGSIR